MGIFSINDCGADNFRSGGYESVFYDWTTTQIVKMPEWAKIKLVALAKECEVDFDESPFSVDDSENLATLKWDEYLLISRGEATLFFTRYQKAGINFSHGEYVCLDFHLKEFNYWNWKGSNPRKEIISQSKAIQENLMSLLLKDLYKPRKKDSLLYKVETHKVIHFLNYFRMFSDLDAVGKKNFPNDSPLWDWAAQILLKA